MKGVYLLPLLYKPNLAFWVIIFIRSSIKTVKKSKELMAKYKKSIPMPQAFWYSQKELFLQQEALTDNQMEEYVLWNATGNYQLNFTY